MKNYPLLFFVIIILSLSCNEVKDCGDHLICTEIYVSLTVQIKDADGEPALLDSAYSIHSASGKVYKNNEALMMLDPGTFILWTDGELDITEKDGSKIRFEGWRSGKKVISEDYLIGHDCCHIELLEGNEIVILN
jgi:hypothetical protein